ncbi:MAG: SIS domain-containing protein [Clostridia bacterium]|nr:SIS domain-containing protein [Clostridia bacterium]
MDFNQLLSAFLAKYPSLSGVGADISAVYDAMVRTYRHNGKIMVCGNGGSAADSEHIVGELMKGFEKRRPLSAGDKKAFAELPHGDLISEKLQKPLCAISLVSQCGVISAFANDVDAGLVYAQQVYGYARENDLLIALSTSGNSKNIVYAAETAKALDLTTVAITGEKESDLSEICDVTVRLPAQSPKDVQELTLPVYHFLCLAVEEFFFKS